jgi:small subunit ribosomal protein S9
MKSKHTHAIGRRKESVARAHVIAGAGTITVNDRPLATYFPRESHRIKVLKPLVVTAQAEGIDVILNIVGGGSSGQTDAAALAIARALIKINPEHKPALRKEGLLTVDSRVVERKKFGRHKARRGTQFSKR